MRKICLLLVLCLLLTACGPSLTPDTTETTLSESQLQSQPTTQTGTEDPTAATAPEATKPGSTKPGTTTPEESKPQESKPEETKPQESKPEESKPQESQPTPTVPEATKPVTTTPQETTPTETVPGATKPSTGSSTECSTHTDSEDDGACDKCGKSLLVIVDFYNINDLHGKIADGENHPGVDELTTYLKKAKKNDDHVVLLSTGDMWQGSSESNLTKGLIATDWMNHLGFAAMSLGNHEYDWGEAPVKENAELAKFPLLAINVYSRSTNQRVSYCKSSVMVNKGGLQIGIIGAIGDCYSSISADKVKDIYFKVDDDLTRLVKAESEKLRSQGADYIVYLLHDGFEQSKSATVTSVSNNQLKYYYDTELSNGYVDLVFEGHTHQRYILKDEHGVYHLQNKGDNKGISHVEVSINTVTGTDKVRYSDLVSTGSYATMADDPIVEELLDKYSDDVSTGSDILGKNARQRSSGELQQLTADLYYKKGMELWGDQYDIVLGGGFISVRSPYTLASGDITYGMLYSLFPFDNDLVLCSIKGRDLRDKFFETDNDRYYISYGDYGSKVKRNIDPNATYYVVVDSYTSVYAPNRLTEIARFDEKPYYARDMLAEYAKAGGFQN